jgi:hypothetical protein
VRIYICCLRIGEAVVGIDVVYKSIGLLGFWPQAEFSWSLPNIEAVSGVAPFPFFTDDLTEAARIAVLGALSEARFKGYVGHVDLAHAGEFNEDDLLPLLELENNHAQLMLLSAGEGANALH